ncbi:hypothetical protein Poli38472_014149 [Pythium oligandrum]|uniref:Uncharacterized protein n=1 Tax=Pythium oligandrum TaxID=41045 RepID=A0A8K1CKQ4_PYTOL|nr:hypothetical protein Poli38472_014149 [Pythium oligandrum]|eukprot:TMW64032.1 hypothetical protein Poli38472_014149 [Pythium oligandrum]
MTSSSWPSDVSATQCTLVSTDIDLSLRDDLAASVQDYLMRIVDELQQLSRWAIECQHRVVDCEKQQHELLKREETQRNTAMVPLSQTKLLVSTETELLRRELHVVSQDVFQRCTTQIAYLQNSFRSEHDEQLSDVHKRLEDKLRFFTQQTLATHEAAQEANNTRLTAAENALRQLQLRVDAEQTRLNMLEESVTASLATLSHATFKLQQEDTQIHRRADSLDSSLSARLSDVCATTQDSLQTLRSTQTQLSAKVQVLRIELQESNEEWTRRLLQLHRLLSRVSGVGDTTGTLAVRPDTGNVSSVANSRAVKVPVGVSAMGDCFLYAKAALPLRESNDGAWSKKTSSVLSTKRVDPSAGQVDSMEEALVIQPSTLSPTIGHEEIIAWSSDSPGTLSPSTPSKPVASSPRKASIRIGTAVTTSRASPQRPGSAHTR